MTTLTRRVSKRLAFAVFALIPLVTMENQRIFGQEPAVWNRKSQWRRRPMTPTPVTPATSDPAAPAVPDPVTPVTPDPATPATPVVPAAPDPVAPATPDPVTPAPAPPAAPSAPETPVVPPVTPSVDPAPAAPAAPSGPSGLTAIWANDGGDKVTQDELRATRGTENLTGTVRNRVWDGSKISLFGARSEVVSFNLVLEAGNAAVSNVSVSFDSLTGPGGASIRNSAPASGNGVFNWVGRPIELFYTRYLQIRGISGFGWYRGDERQLPLRFQRPHVANIGTGGWNDRPDHDKYYPDILVPHELVPNFTVAAGQNESVWCDIYVPKGTPAGTYTGTLNVQENGVVTRTVPVSLNVQPFTLPDKPSVNALTFLDPADLTWRYFTGQGGYVNWASDQGKRVKHISDVYFQMFHRHRIDLVGGETETPTATPGINDFFLSRYDGSLYTAANGYDGPGVNTGTSIYGVGMWGSWGQNINDRQTMWNFANPIGDWFASHFPSVEFFIYLADEPPASQFPQVANWANWLASSPGNGRNMRSMSTVTLTTTNNFMPDLSITASANYLGECPLFSLYSCDNTAYTASALATHLSNPTHQYWMYGGNHPGSGTTNTEDDGIAMRTLPWVQTKVGIDHWFNWYANMNIQSSNWFQTTCSWGCDGARFDPVFGLQSDHLYTNGTGIMVYPGTDVTHPQDSYGVEGPLASLRLKEWRRGMLDGDYLALAKRANPAAAAAILQRVVPAAVWENKAPGWPLGDPSFFLGGVSWSSNPDDWEAARADLANIITSACSTNGSADFCQ